MIQISTLFKHFCHDGFFENDYTQKWCEWVFFGGSSLKSESRVSNFWSFSKKVWVPSLFIFYQPSLKSFFESLISCIFSENESFLKPILSKIESFFQRKIETDEKSKYKYSLKTVLQLRAMPHNISYTYFTIIAVIWSGCTNKQWFKVIFLNFKRKIESKVFFSKKSRVSHFFRKRVPNRVPSLFVFSKRV